MHMKEKLFPFLKKKINLFLFLKKEKINGDVIQLYHNIFINHQITVS